MKHTLTYYELHIVTTSGKNQNFYASKSNEKSQNKIGSIQMYALGSRFIYPNSPKTTCIHGWIIFKNRRDF